MFAELHSDINSPKSGFLLLEGQPYCKKSRSAKVKDGIINLFLKNNHIDRYSTYLKSSESLKFFDAHLTKFKNHHRFLPKT
jgi:hypothetical protein